MNKRDELVKAREDAREAWYTANKARDTANKAQYAASEAQYTANKARDAADEAWYAASNELEEYDMDHKETGQ